MKKLLSLVLLMPLFTCAMQPPKKVWCQKAKNRALAKAVEDRNVAKCRKLIARGADVNASSCRPWKTMHDLRSPINRLFHSSGENNFIGILELLLQAGAQLSGSEEFYLPHCIKTRRTAALKRLLRYGANPEGKESDYLTPLQWAVESNNLEACDALLIFQAWSYKETLTLLMIHRFRKESPLARLPKDILVNHIIPLMRHYNKTERAQRLLNKKGYASNKTPFEIAEEKAHGQYATDEIKAIRGRLMFYKLFSIISFNNIFHLSNVGLLP